VADPKTGGGVDKGPGADGVGASVEGGLGCSEASIVADAVASGAVVGVPAGVDVAPGASDGATVVADVAQAARKIGARMAAARRIWLTSSLGTRRDRELLRACHRS
jgi:hypothetical protein